MNEFYLDDYNQQGTGLNNSSPGLNFSTTFLLIVSKK